MTLRRSGSAAFVAEALHYGDPQQQRVRGVLLEARPYGNTLTATNRVGGESDELRTEINVAPRVHACCVADDYPDMVKAVSRLLALDCEVPLGSVPDGSALLEAAQRLRPDVIVLDVNLPNGHSLEACRELTRRLPRDESDHVHG